MRAAIIVFAFVYSGYLSMFPIRPWALDPCQLRASLLAETSHNFEQIAVVNHLVFPVLPVLIHSNRQHNIQRTPSRNTLEVCCHKPKLEAYRSYLQHLLRAVAV